AAGAKKNGSPAAGPTYPCSWGESGALQCRSTNRTGGFGPPIPSPRLEANLNPNEALRECARTDAQVMIDLKFDPREAADAEQLVINGTAQTVTHVDPGRRDRAGRPSLPAVRRSRRRPREAPPRAGARERRQCEHVVHAVRRRAVRMATKGTRDRPPQKLYK